MDREIKICVIGLGYVGLPLARLFSTKYNTVGFDMSSYRVNALMSGHDTTLELPDELLQTALANGFVCTSDIDAIRDCNFYVVAVPTPVDENNNPDLRPLYNASETIGKVISRGDIVVYESTVYPGVTENECIPVIEKVSGLKFNEDFFAGYSPERINPGDKQHTVEDKKSDLRIHARNWAEDQRSICIGYFGWDSPCSLNQSCGSSQSDRKLSAGYQYSFCKRTFEDFYPYGYRYASGIGGSFHQMEFPTV